MKLFYVHLHVYNNFVNNIYKNQLIYMAIGLNWRGKKKNPKINGQNSQKGMLNNLHKSKFIGSNGGEKGKAHGFNISNGDQFSNFKKSNGDHNTNHSFVKKKTKRLRNENNMPKINGLDSTEHNISTPSIGKKTKVHYY